MLWVMMSLLAFIHGTLCEPSQGANWTGDMHPSLGIGANPQCNMSTLQNCAPTYDQLASANKLWDCPVGDKNTPGTCGGLGNCVTSNNSNSNDPTCPGQLTDEQPCCCPLNGCYAPPLFNTIIGVCKGDGCACGNSEAPGCAPQGAPDRCGSGPNGEKCTGDNVRCCFGANVSELVPFYDQGTQALINYFAAYQYDASSKEWVIQSESSFNTDGRFPPHNLTAQNGGIGDDAWLAPQPGGSAFWSLGYYPAGVKGVGPPGAMFILSTEQFWGGTWYMLNQLTLDRGPASSFPGDKCKLTNNNCWAAGNAGEMDFLETGWNLPNISDDPTFSRSFSTQYNQIGRCFNGGMNGGGFHSQNFVQTSSPARPEPIVYVAVVDSVGNWLYRIPASKVDSVWPGISRKTVAPRLQQAPSLRPKAVNPCVDDYCLVFTSNCQAKNISEARSQGCGFNGDQGWCGNWMAQMDDTGQPLVPNDSCVRDVRGGKTMPWCVDMLGQSSPKPGPSPSPVPPAPPTPKCPKCDSTVCGNESCGAVTPYLCTSGAAKGGCNANSSFWPSSGACSGCCDTQGCSDS